MKNWYNGLSDQWKATLRTGWQNFLGTVLALVLFILVKATDWINGGVVDWSAELNNAGKLLVIAVITVLTSIVTYVQNRGTLGATYPQTNPADRL